MHNFIINKALILPPTYNFLFHNKLSGKQGEPKRNFSKIPLFFQKNLKLWKSENCSKIRKFKQKFEGVFWKLMIYTYTIFIFWKLQLWFERYPGEIFWLPYKFFFPFYKMHAYLIHRCKKWMVLDKLGKQCHRSFRIYEK